MILMLLKDSDGNELECSPFFKDVPTIVEEIDPIEFLHQVGSVKVSLKYDQEGSSDQDQFLQDHRHELYYIRLREDTDYIFSGYQSGKIQTARDKGSVDADFYKYWSEMLDKSVAEDAAVITGTGVNGFRNAITDFIETYMTEGPADIGYPDEDDWRTVRPVESLITQYEDVEYEFDFAGMTVVDALRQICFWGNCGVYYRDGYIVFALKESNADAEHLDGVCYGDETEDVDYNPESDKVTVTFEVAENLFWTPFDEQLNNYIDNYAGQLKKYFIESADDYNLGTRVYFDDNGETHYGTIIRKEFALNHLELKRYVVVDMSGVYNISSADEGEHDLELACGPTPTGATLNVYFNQVLAEAVSLKVYDITPEYKFTIMTRNLVPGEYKVTTDVSALANGNYTVKYESDSDSDEIAFQVIH